MTGSTPSFGLLSRMNGFIDGFLAKTIQKPVHRDIAKAVIVIVSVLVALSIVTQLVLLVVSLLLSGLMTLFTTVGGWVVLGIVALILTFKVVSRKGHTTAQPEAAAEQPKV